MLESDPQSPKMTRRTLFKRAATLAVGLTLGSLLPPLREKHPREKAPENNSGATVETIKWGTNLVENGSLVAFSTFENGINGKTYKRPLGFHTSDQEHIDLIEEADPNKNNAMEVETIVKKLETGELRFETPYFEISRSIPINELNYYLLSVSAMRPKRPGVEPDHTDVDVAIYAFDKDRELLKVISLDEKLKSSEKWQNFKGYVSNWPKGTASAILRFSIFPGKIADGLEPPQILYSNISLQKELTPAGNKYPTSPAKPTST